MSDYAQQQHARAAYLKLKIRSGTATQAERAEYERTKAVVVRETRDGCAMFVEAPPIRVEDWPAVVERVNAENAERLRRLSEDESPKNADFPDENG